VIALIGLARVDFPEPPRLRMITRFISSPSSGRTALTPADNSTKFWTAVHDIRYDQRAATQRRLHDNLSSGVYDLGAAERNKLAIFPANVGANDPESVIDGHPLIDLRRLRIDLGRGWRHRQAIVCRYEECGRALGGYVCSQFRKVRVIANDNTEGQRSGLKNRYLGTGAVYRPPDGRMNFPNRHRSQRHAEIPLPCYTWLHQGRVL
jgi:hypothetical protein